ncbi:MAG: aminopeptidase P family protein [Oscillospiraceae bacterium]|nr:aminopeptidase P family protein [Oscillospiraceae bacterium]
MPIVEKILSKMPQDTAAWVSAPVNCRYLSGFSGSNCLCLISRAGAFYLTDRRFLEAAQKSITALEVRNIESLDELLDSLPERRFAIETAHTTLAALDQRREKYPRLEFDLSGDLDIILREKRAVKTQEEVDCVRRAQSIAEAALERVLPNIRAGRTEREIALELDYTMFSLGAQALSFDTIAVAGENGSLPHGVPTNRKLCDGDLLTLDFGAVVDGYHSDMTRTFAIGKSSEEQERIYNLVLEAQLAGIAAVSAGAECKAVDAAVRAVFERAGVLEFFAHGTGHGVGLLVHESPTVSPKSAEILQEGMIITIEPGLYLPGRFGVRIEDMILVGGGNLTEVDKSLRRL